MFEFIRKIFKKKSTEETLSKDNNISYDYAVAKQKSLERILGPMHELVCHAIIPFRVGGNVDLYYFPHAIDGTGFATMELIEHDERSCLPSRIGLYELVAFTKYQMPNREDWQGESIDRYESAFIKIQDKIQKMFTYIGYNSFETVLNPLDTCEIPGMEENDENRCLIFDEFVRDGVEFIIHGNTHGLLLCIEVYRTEMEHAMNFGSASLISKLKEKGHYPYSDLDRDPVV